LTEGGLEVTGLSADHLRALERTGLGSEQWSTIFPVRTAAADSTRAPVMFGAYALTASGVRFVPRFPPSAGIPYVAVFSPARSRDRALIAAFGDLEIRHEFLVPRRVGPPTTTVEAVYPSTDRVPMNLLKLYLHFSAPMRVGDAYDHIRLADESGAVVEEPFLVVREELWDPERRRFTLFFDPGRIKRDLRPHEEAGLPLREGRSYRLIVDPGWRDGAGRPLASGFEKRLVVGPTDRTSPDPSAWGVAAPGAGTVDAPVVELDEPLDRALLGRMVTVVDVSGTPVPGRVETGADETGWWFVPEVPWSAGRYAVRVDPAIEDLAGNTPNRLFDEDGTAPSSGLPEDVIALLPFEVAARRGAP
jgi:hypothetical protein